MTIAVAVLTIYAVDFAINVGELVFDLYFYSRHDGIGDSGC